MIQFANRARRGFSLALRTCLFTYFLACLSGCQTWKRSPFSTSPTSSQEFARKLLAKLSGMPELQQFKEDGHFNTVEMVAVLAGIEKERALRLSCYAQAPDDIKQYNAVPVAFWGLATPTYRKEIMNGLHSLHGGDETAILHRREVLGRMIVRSLQDPGNDLETGFLIHAYGDSFAHVHRVALSNPERIRAYGPAVGHGFALHDPDEILKGDNAKKYTAYTTALFDLLSTGPNAEKRQQLQTFNRTVESLASESQQTHGILPSVVTQIEISTDESVNVVSCSDIYDHIADKDVRKFLTELAQDLSL